MVGPAVDLARLRVRYISAATLLGAEPSDPVEHATGARIDARQYSTFAVHAVSPRAVVTRNPDVQRELIAPESSLNSHGSLAQTLAYLFEFNTNPHFHATSATRTVVRG